VFEKNLSVLRHFLPKVGDDAHIGVPDCLTASMTVANAPKERSHRHDKNKLVARVANFLLEAGGDLIDVDGVVAEEYALILVDRDDGAFLGNLLDGAGFGDANFDARLQNGSRNHKDDEQHENDINQRSDVDTASAVGCGRWVR